jgi:hypothetical protein
MLRDRFQQQKLVQLNFCRFFIDSRALKLFLSRFIQQSNENLRHNSVSYATKAVIRLMMFTLKWHEADGSGGELKGRAGRIFSSIPF